MTNPQEGNEKMSLSASLFMQANAPIILSIPGLSNILTNIQTTNASIAIAKVQQEADKSGDTTTKNLLRAALILQAIDVSRRMVAYATNINNNSLLALINYREYDLKRSTDSNLISICQVIRDNANTNIAPLGAYGVTAATVTALQTSITTFSTAVPKLRVGTTDSGETTQLLSSLFKTLKVNWKKIDTLVEMVRISQPAFYNEYQRVRKVINLGRGSIALKVKTVNSHTGQPEANVTLIVSAVNALTKSTTSSTKDTIIKKTAKGGGGHIKNLPDGNYVITAKKTGFKDFSVTISIVNGEKKIIQIFMEKE